MASIDTTGSPQFVRLSYTSGDLVAGTERVTLYRTVGNVTSPVRTAMNYYAVGGVALFDYEAPVGSEVTYRLQQFNAAGVALGLSAPITATPSAPAIAPWDAWITDPLDTSRLVPIVLSDTVGQGKSRPSQGSSYRIGRRTVALVGERGLLEKLPFEFYVSDAYLEDLQQILEQSGGLILIRTQAAVDLPNLLYVWVTDLSWERIDTYIPGFGNAHPGTTAYQTTVEQIDPIEGPLIIPDGSWQAYMDEYPTWSAMQTDYTTWLAGMSNPPSN